MGGKELQEYKEKGLYVVPATHEQETYRPMDCIPQILLALLDIGYGVPKDEDILI